MESGVPDFEEHEYRALLRTVPEDWEKFDPAEAACWEVRYTAGRVYHLQPVATSSMAAVIRQTITDRDRKLVNRLLCRWGPAP